VFKHILFPTDGSELSRKALAGAVDLARSLGARDAQQHRLHGVGAHGREVAEFALPRSHPRSSSMVVSALAAAPTSQKKRNPTV
jgi:nucleotide-binding universal stress UspA family protein